MSKKLRVLMLSLFAVLFAVSSAFAITADDLTVTTSGDPRTTEGYNYYQIVYLDTSAITDVSVDVVSWEVYPSGDISWLTWTLGSTDVVIEGRLPEYVSSDAEGANDYTLHVIAHLSGDVESGESTVSGDISADVEGEGLVITVEQEATTVSEFTDMVSIDIASTDRGLYKATDTYSVLINFPTTTAVTITDSVDVEDNPVSGEYVITSGEVFVNAQLEYTSSDIATFEENLSLPSWLKYEVVDTQYAGSYTESDDGSLVYEEDTSTAYVKKLRIFYSADTKPSSNAAGSVRVIVTPAGTPSITDESSTSGTSADRTTQTFEEKYANGTTIGWSVNYYTIPGISLDVTEASYDVIYGTSTDAGSADLVYHYQAPVSVVFSPDISADVYISWDKVATSTSTDEEAGYITLTVSPITPLIKTYSTDMIITDSYDNTAAVKLYISVSMDAMFISPDTSASVSVDVGASKDVSFVAYNFSGSVKSWDLGTIPGGITVTPVTGLPNATRYNNRIVYTVTGVTEGRYSFDITAVDSSDRSADITVSVTVSTRPVPPAPGVSFSITPASTTVTVKAGASQDVSFTASNNSGNVTWTLGAQPSGVTIAPSASAYATQGNTRMVYTVTGKTVGSYSATVTAKDAGGKTATATISISVTSDDVPGPTPVTPEESGDKKAEALTPETIARAQSLIDSGALTGDASTGGTLPESSVKYTTDASNPLYVTLSRTGTTSVTRSDTINPILLVLSFDVDIWRVYINNSDTAAAWAYSPGVSGSGYDDEEEFSAADKSTNGIKIIANSKREAEVHFDPAEMPSGTNVITAAFVEDANNPTQEIGRTTLATINVSGSSSGGDERGVGSSSGGCSAGLGAVVSALAAAFFISKKRS